MISAGTGMVISESLKGTWRVKVAQGRNEEGRKEGRTRESNRRGRMKSNGEMYKTPTFVWI